MPNHDWRRQMSESANDLQRLTDRAALQDLLLRYFQGLDRCNPEQVRSCFTDDVQAHYDHRPAIKGIDALMSGFRTFKRIADGKMKVTTHFMGNLNITSLQRDTVETETNALAFLVEPGEGNDLVSIRSLRYIDRMRREESGWRI